MDVVQHNKRVRAGCFFQGSFSSEFFPFEKFLPNFSDAANVFSDRTLRHPEYPSLFQEVFGRTIAEQINDFYDLKQPFHILVETKCLVGDLFGYKFDNPVYISFDPKRLEEIATLGATHFWIATDAIEFDVAFRQVFSVKERTVKQSDSGGK
ncbi:MAG: hypothetical protein ABI618_03255 [Nitrospirota bacterium]